MGRLIVPQNITVAGAGFIRADQSSMHQIKLLIFHQFLDLFLQCWVLGVVPVLKECYVANSELVLRVLHHF